MAKTMMVALVATVLGFSAPVLAQQADSELQKLVDQYQQAFNKGDAKALAALYTTDALRLGTDGQLLTGRDAIQKRFAELFAGQLKGAKLTLRPGRTVNVSTDVRVQEGTVEASGLEGGPTRMRYLNTVARQGGQWRLASVTVVPQTDGANKP